MISVIVPFHNAEQYIAETAECLMRQTISDDDVEFIFVNDASTDRSEEILQEVLYRYPERPFAVLHHNYCRGLMTARYTGLLNCWGDYVIFCDADDLVDPDFYATLHHTTQTDPAADIIMAEIRAFHDTPDRNTQPWADTPVRTTDAKLLAQHIFHLRKPHIHGSLCSKLIRKTLFDGLTSDESIRYCEDLLWLLPILFRTSSIAYANAVYHYRQHANSMVATRLPSDYAPTRRAFAEIASDPATRLPMLSLSDADQALLRACAKATARRMRHLAWRRRIRNYLRR